MIEITGKYGDFQKGTNLHIQSTPTPLKFRFITTDEVKAAKIAYERGLIPKPSVYKDVWAKDIMIKLERIPMTDEMEKLVASIRSIIHESINQKKETIVKKKKLEIMGLLGNTISLHQLKIQTI